MCLRGGINSVCIACIRTRTYLNMDNETAER